MVQRLESTVDEMSVEHVQVVSTESKTVMRLESTVDDLRVVCVTVVSMESKMVMKPESTVDDHVLQAVTNVVTEPLHDENSVMMEIQLAETDVQIRVKLKRHVPMESKMVMKNESTVDETVRHVVLLIHSVLTEFKTVMKSELIVDDHVMKCVNDEPQHEQDHEAELLDQRDETLLHKYFSLY